MFRHPFNHHAVPKATICRSKPSWPHSLKPMGGWTGRRMRHSTSNGGAVTPTAHSPPMKFMWHLLRQADRNVNQATPSNSWNTRRALQKVFQVTLLGVFSSVFGVSSVWLLSSNRGIDSSCLEENLTQSSQARNKAKEKFIEDTINNHPMVMDLRQRAGLTESRPNPDSQGLRPLVGLTDKALSGPGKIPVPPYIWTESGGKSLVSIVWVGEDLCSYPGIVHGGFSATLLDEGLARCCFGALPHKVGVTANLTINYHKPTPTEAFLVVRAETTKVEGRKAWVSGRIESLTTKGEEPDVYAEATGFFVSPKFAAGFLIAVAISYGVKDAVWN